ncbi:hypothetical protein REPUB_Repub18cG0025800 [Reevesia pubescens]
MGVNTSFEQYEKYMEEKCGSSHDNPSKHLDSCCEQLEKMDRQCTADALLCSRQCSNRCKKDMGRQEMQQMYPMAGKIMSKCEMEPRTCDMPSRSWF